MKKISKKNRYIIAISIIIILILSVILWGFIENNCPKLTKYTIESSDLPSSFKGYKIAQISDLHNAEIGEGNQKVLDLLKTAEPDIILLTGDLIDSRKTKIDVAVDFAKKASAIAPCFYSGGNHESRLEDFESFAKQLELVGVKVLQNQKLKLNKGEEFITLIGVTDPAFFNEYPSENDGSYMEQTLENLLADDDGFRVVISHRPELMQVYSTYNLDVVFSGHAHGGQFILPLIGGLYAPGQGFFPKHTQGVIKEGKTNLVISRGVGNSAFPFRLNNRPEVVLVEFKN